MLERKLCSFRRCTRPREFAPGVVSSDPARSADLTRSPAPRVDPQADVLRDDLRPGDEVALRPGRRRLTYDGAHVPVTDVVYLASGLVIVPVIDQVRATLPKGRFSVPTSSVVWLNRDRDLAMDDLEGEYLKHPNKLAVSCVVDDAAEGTGD